jgi:hypothetical protein
MTHAVRPWLRETPMNRKFAQVVADLRMLLLDEPPCTTADVTDGAVIYLDGDELKGVFLSADEPGGLDEPLRVDEWFVGQVEENLKDWFASPTFSYRPQLANWKLDAPPVESLED